MKQRPPIQTNHSVADLRQVLDKVLSRMGISAEDLITILESDQGFIGSAEVASLLGIERQTLRVWISDGKLPEGFPQPYKVNRTNKWLRKDVNAYFANLTNKV